MQYRATFHFTEQLVRKSVLSFWLRAVGGWMLVLEVLIAGYFVWLVLRGDRSWLVGMLGLAVLLGIAMPVVLYVVHYRHSLSTFRAMKTPVAEMLADDESFTLSSGMGTGTMKWPAVTEVWRFDYFWLLLISKAQFVTVPLADVPEDMRNFILDRVRAAGGTIK